MDVHFSHQLANTKGQKNYENKFPILAPWNDVILDKLCWNQSFKKKEKKEGEKKKEKREYTTIYSKLSFMALP